MVGAAVAIRLGRSRTWEGLPAQEAIRLDPLVIGGATLVTLAVGAGLGLLAVRRALGSASLAAIRAGTPRNGASAASTRTRRGLVVAELAMALTLLTSAGLLVANIERLLDVDLGFETAGVIAMELSVPSGDYPSVAVGPFYVDLVDRVAAQSPLLRSAAVTSALPFGGRNPNTSLDIEGRPSTSGTADVAGYRIVTPAYFATMGIPIRRGRSFDLTDAADTLPVALVNEVAAERYWPGDNPVGRRIRLAASAPWLTIVGVAGTTTHVAFDAPPQPELYLARAQPAAIGGLGIWRTMSLVVRVDGEPDRAVPFIRQTLASIDPGIPLSRIRTMKTVVGDTLVAARMAAGLVGFFALSALALAGVGVYGVLAQVVGARTREIAIRGALGAGAAAVARFVASQVAGPVAAGLLLGIAGGVGANLAIQGLLFDAAPVDPAAIAAATLVLAAGAIAAVLPSVRRAIRTDPAEALKE